MDAGSEVNDRKQEDFSFLLGLGEVLQMLLQNLSASRTQYLHPGAEPDDKHAFPKAPKNASA